ncbi:hypothetical protein H5T57_02980 [Candidatus Bipolaricaulota bacterium]|nr:hypothetical protein [Candidatus Bipolaricaulota bacterium]
MRLIYKFLVGGGVAAFFFFAWVIMMLWNSIVAGHLGILPPLSYLQACGLWFLVTLLFAWVGMGVGWRLIMDREERVERRVRKALARWLGREDLAWDELGELLEKRIKENLRRWLEES